jgi:hypothetical protein
MSEVVVATGLVVGVVCVSTVCLVFARHGSFGLGGSVLCFTGLLLIGLSVWKNAEVQVGNDGVTVKVTALQESVQNLKDASAALNTQVQGVARAADTIRTSSEQALNDIQAAVQKEHPAMATGLRPVALGRPVYDAAGFRAIDTSLATSAQALLRAKEAPVKAARPPD